MDAGELSPSNVDEAVVAGAQTNGPSVPAARKARDRYARPPPRPSPAPHEACRGWLDQALPVGTYLLAAAKSASNTMPTPFAPSASTASPSTNSSTSNHPSPLPRRHRGLRNVQLVRRDCWSCPRYPKTLSRTDQSTTTHGPTPPPRSAPVEVPGRRHPRSRKLRGNDRSGIHRALRSTGFAATADPKTSPNRLRRRPGTKRNDTAPQRTDGFTRRPRTGRYNPGMETRFARIRYAWGFKSPSDTRGDHTRRDRSFYDSCVWFVL